MDTDEYDAYHLWLGIPPDEQPPSHYRLLGVRLFEENMEVIRNAADRQRSHVKRLGTNQFERIGQDLLNQIEAAKICLLRPERRLVYDKALRADLKRLDASEPGTTFEEQLGEETLIVGSDPNCDIVADLPTISGIHCSVMRRQDRVILRDLKSTNGTFINFNRVLQPSKITLTDLIVLGRDTRLKLPVTFFPAAMRSPLVTFVGRNEQCEIVISDHSVSSFHARLWKENGGTFVEDLGSTNGTSLATANGRIVKVPPRNVVEINRYQKITFGKHHMLVDQLINHTALSSSPSNNSGSWSQQDSPLLLDDG